MIARNGILVEKCQEFHDEIKRFSPMGEKAASVENFVFSPLKTWKLFSTKLCWDMTRQIFHLLTALGHSCPECDFFDTFESNYFLSLTVSHLSRFRGEGNETWCCFQEPIGVGQGTVGRTLNNWVTMQQQIVAVETMITANTPLHRSLPSIITSTTDSTPSATVDVTKGLSIHLFFLFLFLLNNYRPWIGFSTQLIQSFSPSFLSFLHLSLSKSPETTNYVKEGRMTRGANL